tara:strand:+ start:113 stop:418 length:306 start_codon:yes stop_codon:yes gene_type:complete
MILIMMMTMMMTKIGMMRMTNLFHSEAAAVLNHPLHLDLHRPEQDPQAVQKVGQDLPEALLKDLKDAVQVPLLLVQAQLAAELLHPDGHQQANHLLPSQNR